MASVNDVLSRSWKYAIAAGADITSGQACRIHVVWAVAKEAAESDLKVYNNTSAAAPLVIDIDLNKADFDGAALTTGFPLYVLNFGTNGLYFGTGLTIGSVAAPGSLGVAYSIE